MEFIIAGVITGLAILVALRQWLNAHRAKEDFEYWHGHAGNLRLCLLDVGKSAALARESAALEKDRGNRIAEASRETYFENLRLRAQVKELEDEVDDADELIEELEAIAEESVAGWIQATSVADRALTVAERALGGPIDDFEFIG